MKAVKNVLASYIMFILDEPIKVAHLPKLTNKSMMNGALGIEMVNNSFSES